MNVNYADYLPAASDGDIEADLDAAVREYVERIVLLESEDEYHMARDLLADVVRDARWAKAPAKLPEISDEDFHTSVFAAMLLDILCAVESWLPKLEDVYGIVRPAVMVFADAVYDIHNPPALLPQEGWSVDNVADIKRGRR